MHIPFIIYNFNFVYSAHFNNISKKSHIIIRQLEQTSSNLANKSKFFFNSQCFLIGIVNNINNFQRLPLKSFKIDDLNI